MWCWLTCLLYFPIPEPSSHSELRRTNLVTFLRELNVWDSFPSNFLFFTWAFCLPSHWELILHSLAQGEIPLSSQKMWHREGNEPSRYVQPTQGPGRQLFQQRQWLLGFSMKDCVTWTSQKWRCQPFFLSAAGACTYLTSTTPAQAIVFGRHDCILCSETRQSGCLDSKPSLAACDLVWYWKVAPPL